MADIIDVNIGDQVLEVFWQDEVELNLDMDLMYIKSGQKEIQDYVDNVSKPEINSYIETEAKPIVKEVVNTIAEPLVEEYMEGTVKPDIDTYTNEKLDAFNTNAATLVAEYNANATEKTDAFNTNASEKQALVDAGVATATAQAGIATEQATAAANSATAASNYASNASADADNAAESAGLAANSAASAATSKTNAKIWADGTDSEVQALGGVHSSKGWSEIAKDIIPSQTGNDGKFLTTDGTNASWADVGGGLEIGDIGFAPLGVDEAQNKRRYLNGQVISQAQFVSFTNKIKSAIELYPSLATTETNWQAEVTNSKLGQCGKFVIDDTAGTIRLPKVVNINGLTDLALMGSIKAESLPNIADDDFVIKANTTPTGLLNDTGVRAANSAAGNVGVINYATFDASRSSSTYQDNAPVQQEAIQYPYFIQVATGVEESIDVTREIELNNPFSLLDYKWSEYELNNASWLLSNGQFNSGATYVAVYELLLKIKNGTETKDGVSVKLSTEAYADTDFVINTADTTFRLPIKVKLASGNRVAGNGMTLGFTDGTNNGGMVSLISTPYRINARTGNYGENVGSAVKSGDMTDATLGVTTDPTKSGIETSSSGLKLYFYVGETIQDANVIAASQVLTKVANGIDRTVATDRETVVGWGMPDYSAGVTLTKGIDYTAPSDGYIMVSATTSNNQSTNTFIFKIDNITILNREMYTYSGMDAGVGVEFCIPISKGSVANLTTSGIVNTYMFYPFKGVN